jgi:outer membrane lipoprotein-sorting protein
LKKLRYLTICCILIFNFDYHFLFADEKEKIIQKLQKTDSIKFNFIQKNNNTEEHGSCFLLFPQKLKCIYSNKRKELFINNNQLAIVQKRYNKIYYYPISKSAFSKILNKDQLINLIKISSMQIVNEQIELTNKNKNQYKLIILFNKNNYDLLGWKVEDQFQNNISFLINIESTNNLFEKKIFKIPELN